MIVSIETLQLMKKLKENSSTNKD